MLFANPFYKDKFCVIADSLDTKDTKKSDENKKIIKQFSEFERLLDKRFIKLNESELEKYYKNLDQTLHNNFYAQIDKKKRQSTKGDFAKKIAEKIKTPQDFQILFNNELDILLKINKPTPPINTVKTLWQFKPSLPFSFLLLEFLIDKICVAF